jgi:hypothetical protein
VHTYESRGCGDLFIWFGGVPDRRRQILPEVVLVRCWVTGCWELGGGEFGERVGQGRSVYKQPETEVDGSCHS